MRRRPPKEAAPRQIRGQLVTPPRKAGKASPKNVATQMDVVEPFLVSGGEPFFRSFSGDVVGAGTQMVCSVYVPKGRVAFIKQIRCAPFMPTLLADPWWTTGVSSAGIASWRDWNGEYSGVDPADIRVDELPLRPGGHHGVWETPLGWQACMAWGREGSNEVPTLLGDVPSWTWSLRYMQGDIAALRYTALNLPDPDFTPDGDGDIPVSSGLVLIPNVAVPSTVYPAGLPGTSPGPNFGAQPVQVLQGDQLSVHAMVPEDTTAILFTQWTQTPMATVCGRDKNGRIIYSPATEEGGEDPDDFRVYPLLPSFGSLSGYMQSRGSAPALHNAQLGWGG